MDMEKVVRAFEQYVYNFVELTTTDEYNHQILEQVLALLKEQEAKQVNISQTHCGMKYGLCPRCEKQIDTLVNPHYCGNCGQELKWK
jgi:exosome complex RNA-binding protein Csl4